MLFRSGGFVLSHDFQSPFQVCDFCCVFCNPCPLFFFTFIQKKVQQVLYIGFFLDCFHKTGVRFFLQCPGRIVGLPFFQQIVVIGQYAITPLPVLPKLLCLVFLPDIPPAGRGLTVIDQAKVLCQFLRRFFWGEVKELDRKSTRLNSSH